MLVVDNHLMFAEALKALLTGEQGVEMIGVATTGERALNLAASDPPDVALVDIELPGIDGVETTRRLRQLCPQAQVVMLTAFPRPETVARLVEAGACGFVPKTQAADGLVETIRQAAAGEVVLPTRDGGADLDRLREVQPPRSDARILLGQLTTREMEILKLVAMGRSTQQVAEALSISPLTVRTHVKNMLAKLGVHSRLEAVILAMREGLVEMGTNR